MKNYRADIYRPAAQAVVSSLNSLSGEVTLTKASTWGPGPRTFAKLTVDKWSYTLQLSGLRSDESGLRGPGLQKSGWAVVALREEVEEYLHARLVRALDTAPAVAQPSLPMERGDARDRRAGWDVWPAGPEHAENSVSFPG